MFSQRETESDSADRAAVPSVANIDAAATVYTPQEIADRCGLSRRRIYDWLSWGWLRGRRRGGRWVVTADDWDFFTGACRGARGRLMPSLREWGPAWQSRPAEDAVAAGDGPPPAPKRRR